MQVNARTTSFKIPRAIEKKIHVRMVEEGYGLRGKSQWINDSIQFFLSLEEEFCIESVIDASFLENLDKAVSFRPSKEIDRLLSQWIVKVRAVDPTLEGVKSNIIRAAILQNIIQKSTIKALCV